MANTREPYRKLTRTGNGSYYIVIPPHLIRELGWKERQKLEVKLSGKKIIVKDWKKPRSKKNTKK